MKNLAFNTLKFGVLVGTFDILAALVQYYLKTQKNPITVLNFIASGVFGKEAFSGGNKMAAFGLLFHYLIALGFTLLFFVLYPKLKALIQNKFFLGSLYGLFIWLTMQFVIVPLSRAPIMKLKVEGAITAILILIVCIGIPLSLYAGTVIPNRKNN
ncbi:hypothetical protein [Pedobacter insulae]|uniref:DUF1440 domain-containing protein n=1 Tax=Pedobacter insulae TaxID=414048 RepID=A0A1I2VYC5_9SPHI|nr:hypothetical protein [Pedobacter insulae]SFG94042.1 hypothetical protein SAMN04489864_103344 [Pedobacter insulae]